MNFMKTIVDKFQFINTDIKNMSIAIRKYNILKRDLSPWKIKLNYKSEKFSKFSRFSKFPNKF